MAEKRDSIRERLHLRSGGYPADATVPVPRCDPM